MSNNQALSATDDTNEDTSCILANVEATLTAVPNNKTSLRTVTSSIPSTSTHSDNSLERRNKVKATVLPGVDDPIYVTVPGPNDILLGRGAPIINYEGNIRFRALVSTRKLEYIGCGRHQVKDGIAKSIIDEIERREGRFLRRVDPAKALIESSGTDSEPASSDADKAKVTGRKANFTSNKLYQVAEYDVALEKVKQALRDKETMKHHLDSSDESGASSSHAATLLHGQQHHQFMNVTNPGALSTVVYGNNVNAVGRPQDANNRDTGNSSHDFVRNQQLQILSMQVQNRLASENLLMMNQQRLLQQNQRYLSDLLNPPPVQSLTFQQRMALLHADSLSSIAASPSRDYETALNNLRNRQQAEFLSLINSSVESSAAASALLSRNNVVNPYLRPDGPPLSNIAASVLEQQLLNRLMPGTTTQSSYWTAATALGLGDAAGTQRMNALLPSYQASALLPAPPMGAALSMSKLSDGRSSGLIRSVGSESMVSSTMQIMLGDSPQIFDDIKNKRNSPSEEKGGSVSSSSTRHSKESSIEGEPTSKKRFKAN
jgi:hypothetical protein